MRLPMFFGMLLIAAFVSSAASAQVAVVTVVPGFQGGVHTACALNFDVELRDTQYLNNTRVQASGSFNLYNFPDKGVATLLKLGIGSLEQPDLPFVAPTTAYLISGFKTNKSEQTATFDSDKPGFRLFGFSSGDQTLTAIVRIEVEGTLDVGYTLGDGTGAQTFSVPLTAEQSSQWKACQDALLSS